jgi:tetratricopeptide (TPR) repeat protein
MGDLLSLIGEIWTDFSARPPLDQVSIAFSIVLPIAGATGTLTWLVVRRLFQKEVGLLENEVKSLTGRLAVRTTERDTALERVRTLEAQLADVNPRDWLAAFEKDRSLGNDNRAIETLRDGFERVAPDLRKAVMELAWDQFTRGDAERPHHFSEAWRLSAIARAISIGDDVAELRDGLREIDAEIAQRTGRYDSSDPKWDVFEQAKGLDDPAAAAQTTDALIQRAQQSTRNGRYWEAERMARRAETIARRSEGPEAQRALVAGFGRVQAILLQDRREEALSAVDALLSVEERVQGPAHPGTLATRHLRADTLNRLGRREEALSAVDALLPVQEQVDTSKYRLILVFGGWGRLARALAVPSVH